MTVKFYNKYQLHKCCADDDLRIAMNFVHFMNGYAYATNAHVIVRVALTEMIEDCTPEIVEMLNNHSISAKNYARIIRHKQVELTPDGFVYNNEYDRVETLYRMYEIGEGNVIKDYYDKNSTYSKYQPIIPDMERVLPTEKDILVPIGAIGVNLASLNNVSAGMGGENNKRIETLDLYFTGDSRAIICKKKFYGDNHMEDAIGLVMPCIIDTFEYNLKKCNNKTVESK